MSRSGERILLIRLGALGDVANVMPAVGGLRRARPEARLTWLVEQGAAGLARIDRDLDEVIVFPRRRISADLRLPWQWVSVGDRLLRVATALRRRRFDRVLDFQGNIKSGLLSAATGCRWRAGFDGAHAREQSHLCHTVLIDLADEPRSRRERAIALVRALAPEAEPATPDLWPGREAESTAEAVFASAGEGPRVVMHPGVSGFGEFKRWPAERYGEVARELGEARGAVTLVTRGPDDEPRAVETLIAASDGHALPAPLLDLPQLTALLRRADLFIGADTGPLHMAALVGTRCVAIFGPKDPRVYAPPGARVVRRDDLECSPCRRRRCDDLRCLRLITPGQVAEAAMEELGRRE